MFALVISYLYVLSQNLSSEEWHTSAAAAALELLVYTSPEGTLAKGAYTLCDTHIFSCE